MSRKPARVQIEGRRGPLSPEQSRAVLDKLQAGAQDTSLLDRHMAFEQAVVDSPLLAGNKVTLLVDGPSTYKAMFAAIAQARDHINMETYILEDDEIGKQFADTLIDKQRAGVQVNLIHDGVGTLGTPAPFFERLKEAGIRVLEYNPVNPLRAKAGWDVNGRDHRKLLVVDGRTAFLGGINISSVYSGGSFSRSSRPVVTRDGHLPWRDTDLQIDGPVVAEFQKLFLETWQRQKGDALPDRQYFPSLPSQGNEVVRAVGSGPDDPYSLIYATLISALSHAENEILLANAYFVPDPQLLEAITAAARRGVDVKLLLPRSLSGFPDAPRVS
jgi:cardiolipin synthase